MSSVTSCTATLGFVALASALFACGGSGVGDLFGQTTGNGACPGCGPNDATGGHDNGAHTTGAGGAAGSGIVATTGSGGAPGSTTTGSTTGGTPGTGGAP